MRTRSPWGVLKGLGLGLLVLCAAALVAPRLSAWREETIAPTGPLVQQIRQLGQLRTVRYEVRDVMEHTRALEPDGWARALPGARTLYRAATRNSVLVTAEGGVEAGVDLTRVTPESVTQVAGQGQPRVRVRLPRAVLFTPDVKLRVVQRRPGLFWQDDNIVPEATEQERQRIAEAARRSDILNVAEANAVRVLTDLQRTTGNTNVEFYF